VYIFVPVTTPSKTDVSLNDIKAALQRSGYLIESRIDAVLRKRGYYVESNVSHVDPVTGKPREIDLSALQAFRAGKRTEDFVWSLCLIECVNSPQPIALFTRPDAIPFMRRELIYIAGVPVRLLTGSNKWTAVPEAIETEKYHHYCRGRIATQFCSFTAKKANPPELFAQHVPDHFNSFSKLLDAIRESSNEVADCWFDAGDARYEHLNIQFMYPIVVVTGAPLFDVIQHRDQLDVRERPHFLYRASGILNQQVVEYLVDVVTEEAFPRLISVIDREMKTIARQFQDRSKTVRKSLTEIYHRAKRIHSVAEMRNLTQWPLPRSFEQAKTLGGWNSPDPSGSQPPKFKS